MNTWILNVILSANLFCITPVVAVFSFSLSLTLSLSLSFSFSRLSPLFVLEEDVSYIKRHLPGEMYTKNPGGPPSLVSKFKDDDWNEILDFIYDLVINYADGRYFWKKSTCPVTGAIHWIGYVKYGSPVGVVNAPGGNACLASHVRFTVRYDPVKAAWCIITMHPAL